MLVLALRRLSALAIVASCASGDYLTDAGARREALEASLVNHENGYARLRLARYASGASDDWEKLPISNPPSMIVRELPSAPLDSSARPTPTSGDLRAIGEEAFFQFPVQPAPAAEELRSNEEARAYGFWIDERGVGGLVRTPAGLAYTCATCHVRRANGALVIGAPNDALDLGALMIDHGHGSNGPRAWGPGRLDVTTRDGSEPVRVADLRPVRLLTHLHADGNVRQLGAASLAVRIETLIITSSGERARPPREIALGLAEYVLSLADSLPSPPKASPIFEARCARCHAPPSLTGPPVPIEEVGTDPVVGRSADRGTGAYRVPSLRGVSTRGRLLHDASVRSLSDLFDPARAGGHRFGLDLDASDRASLLAYLGAL